MLEEKDEQLKKFKSKRERDSADDALAFLETDTKPESEDSEELEERSKLMHVSK